MFAKHYSSLIAEMERVKSLTQLTPEERKKEVRRRTNEELRAVEKERRERVAQEALEKLQKEREEKGREEERARKQREEHLEERRIQEAKQREEEKRKADELKALQEAEQEQLKQERLHCNKVIQVEEKPDKRPRYTMKDLAEEQRAEPCRPLRMGVRDSRDLLTSEEERKTTLINNWVGDGEPEKKPLKGESHRNSATLPLFATKETPKSEEKADKETSKPRESEWRLPQILKAGYWMDRYQDHREKKNQKRKQKAEEQYARWAALKASRAGYVFQQNDSYARGFAGNRNSILKSVF